MSCSTSRLIKVDMALFLCKAWAAGKGENVVYEHSKKRWRRKIAKLFALLIQKIRISAARQRCLSALPFPGDLHDLRSLLRHLPGGAATGERRAH